MDKKLKLYVWDDILWSYTSGLVCVLACDLEEAYNLIRNKYKKADMRAIPELKENKPKIIDSPEAFLVYGGD